MIRKFLKIIGIIVLAVVLLGLAGYYALFKPDLELQQELKAEFGEEFFEINDTGSGTAAFSSRDDDPAQKYNVSQKETMVQMVVKGIEKMTGTYSKTAAGKTDETQPVSVMVGPVNTDKQAAPVGQDQEEIIEKYAPQFQSLQSQSVSRLEVLYASVIAESRVQTAYGTSNRTELIRKYIQAGSMLESAADKQFYNILHDLQAELAANGLPTEIINNIESEYLSAKSGKRSELLGRVGL